ncbi:hypothetical protein JMUB7540_28160 [Staphylococcus aureus]
MDSIKKRGGFNKINAVKNTRIEVVNGDEVSRPGPRIDEGLKAVSYTHLTLPTILLV